MRDGLAKLTAPILDHVVRVLGVALVVDSALLIVACAATPLEPAPPYSESSLPTRSAESALSANVMCQLDSLPLDSVGTTAPVTVGWRVR